MTYILDTHAFLWALTDPSSLSHPTRELLEDRSTDLIVSSASAWEIATKHRLGKLPQAEVLVAGYVRHVRRLGARELDITSDHALLAGRLEWEHRDPFDRMLAAQCMAEGMTLITKDAAFSGVPGVPTFW